MRDTANGTKRGGEAALGPVCCGRRPAATDNELIAMLHTVIRSQLQAPRRRDVAVIAVAVIITSVVSSVRLLTGLEQGA